MTNMTLHSLYKMDKDFTYDGPKTNVISFPLGGIGTGCIGIAGNGRLIDWEIFNRPNKNGDNGFSFFAIKAEHKGELKVARVLHGDLNPPYIGRGTGKDSYGGFGMGVDRETLAGFPHFTETVFKGQFPIAELQYKDSEVPLGIKLTAFNPFIPNNDKDSSLPGAILIYEVTNHSDEELDISVAGNLTNPFQIGAINELIDMCGCKGMKLHSNHFAPDAPEYGDLTLTTDGQDVSYQSYWYRGGWFDNLTVFWKDFVRPGKFTERKYENPREIDWTNLVYSQKKILKDVCLLSSHQTLAPGERGTFKFTITWNFPNFINYWNPGPGESPPVWKNYYANFFPDSTHSAEYIFNHFDRLYRDTASFKEALFQSSYPDYVIDAVSANMSTLKSPTCLRLTDGTLYGFEGCFSNGGCCEGTCTHVWNYDQVTPYLFPALERSMHDIYYKYNKYDEHGKMAFRMMLPPENTKTVKSINNGAFKPAADGQMGSIIRVYRDWKLSGDTGWLRSIWPDVKKALEYAWSPANPYGWDKDRDGVMEGIQHQTLDVELYGPSSYLSGLYQAALLAASEMAAALGDEAGKLYYSLFEKGSKWVDEHLFNGEYYHQQLDLTDDRYPIDPELGQIKYQIGEGCHIDQVLGQWHAHLSGLGYIFDRNKVKRALQSIYDYNFVKMRNYPNACRIFALDDEQGVLICTWPKENSPKVPVPYADETMHGFEYQVACHMIYEGLLDQGLEIVQSIRERYDGEKRNPWSEIESGSNYARSMASYSLLIALSGFEYNLVEGMIGFHPKINADDFRTFWSVDGAWGEFTHRSGICTLRLVMGEVQLGSFVSDLLLNKTVKHVVVDGKRIPFVQNGGSVRFETVMDLHESLEIVL